MYVCIILLSLRSSIQTTQNVVVLEIIKFLLQNYSGSEFLILIATANGACSLFGRRNIGVRGLIVGIQGARAKYTYTEYVQRVHFHAPRVCSW